MSTPTPTLPALVTVPEAALALRVSTSTIRRWIREGHLNAVRVGPGSVRVEVAAVQRLVDRGAVA
jgi:excisionase family DNA binding protein